MPQEVTDKLKMAENYSRELRDSLVNVVDILQKRPVELRGLREWDAINREMQRLRDKQPTE